MPEKRFRRTQEGVKRGLDVLLAALGLALLAPLFLLVALAVKLDSPGPVFYRGARVGRYGRRFAMFKFRTMVAEAESRGPSSTASDDRRITRVGALLRRYKLDELPQLINVLRGEMSLVGPRPQVPWIVERYSAAEQQLLAVRPGITDYASLRFADEGEILRGSADPDGDYLSRIHPEKVRLGLEYVRGWSLAADFRILVRTLFVLFGGSSRAHPTRGGADAPPVRGGRAAWP